jgi:AcrR family transcriptional regulator
MEAARELMLELGDQERLSVRGVTARAGVSANALYLHFAGKEDLLTAVMLAGYTEMRDYLREAVPPQAPPQDQLRAYGNAYIRFATERPGLYRVLLMTKVREGVPVPERDGPVGEDEGVDTFNDFLEIVARCLPAGSDSFAQAAYFWTGLHGYVTLAQTIPVFPWPAAAEYVERMIELHIDTYSARLARAR